MKVSFMSISRWPSELADSRIMVKMSEQCALLGNQVDYIVPKRNIKASVLAGTSPWKYYQIKPNCFNVTRLPVINFYWLEFIHLRYLTLNISYLISSAIYLIFHRPHLIYSYQKEIILLKFLFPDTKFILEFHDIPSDQYQQALFKLVFGQVDLWITPNRALNQFLLAYHRTAPKSVIVPAGYDSNLYQQMNKTQARKKLLLPHNKKIIGYIGNLSGKDGSRGLETLLQAIQRLVPTKTSILLISVGGEHKQIKQYRQLATQMHINKYVKFIPQSSHDLVSTYLSAFDVCVMPFPNKPHYRRYMSPMKMIEYMACGRPIVTTDLPSVREILSSESAIFVKPDDPTDLANGLLKGLQPTSMTKANKALGLVKKYTWKNRAHIIFNESLINQ